MSNAATCRCVSHPGRPPWLRPIGLQARIRWNVVVPNHDAPFAGPMGAWGAGPILTAACRSHSPERRTAHPGWLSGLRWRSPSACFSSLFFALRHCPRRLSGGGEARAGRHFSGLDVAPQRHQQLAGERHGHDLADAPFGVPSTLDEPATERAVRLHALPAPSQLHQQPAYPRIAVLADALLAFRTTAAERCPGEADKAGDRLAVAEAAAEYL